MKTSQKNYDQKFRNKNRLELERSLRAANRLESYSFYKDSRHGPPLSSELQGNFMLKKEFYSSLSNDSLWSDRNSIIAAPYSAELYLENERAMSEVFLGAPRYYYHELARPEIPNARPRFPYDRVAHRSAKIITRCFRLNLNRRLHAAFVIKRSMRRYVSTKLSQLELFLLNRSMTKLQQLFRRRRNLFKENAAIYRQLHAEAREKKRLAREEDERRNREGAKKIFLTIAWAHLTRRARAFIHRKRRERGIRRREYNFACRVQATFRGQRTRRELKRRRDAGIFLLCAMRKHWRRKHLKDVLKIQRVYRNYQLKRAVISIQNLVRRKAAMRRRDRVVLEMVAHERNRANRECLVLTDYLQQLSLDLRWMDDEEQVPFITTEDHLKRIDFYCLAVLCGHPLQAMDPYIESVHPADFGEDDYAEVAPRLVTTSAHSHEQRVVIAILNLFINRPGSCLDGNVFSILRDSGWLRPKKRGGGTSSAPFSLPQEAWATLEKIPLLNTHSLAQLLEPTKSLLFRVNILGQGRYLPVLLLQQSLLVNRWTLYCEFLLRKRLKSFRKLFPPRRSCPQCLEPMVFDGQLYDHRRCCRNGFPSWMISDMKGIYDALKEQCRRVKTIENYKRDYSGDHRRLAEGLKGVAVAVTGGQKEKQAEQENDSLVIAPPAPSPPAPSPPAPSPPAPSPTAVTKEKM
jgi:hypothetical protein